MAASSELLSLTVRRLGGDTVNFENVPLDGTVSQLCEKIADKLEVDVGEMNLSHIPGEFLNLIDVGSSTLGELGFKDNLELLVAVTVAEQALDPKVLRCVGAFYMLSDKQGLEDEAFAAYIGDYRLRRQTHSFANAAAERREARRQALETIQSSAHRRGVQNEGFEILENHERSRWTCEFAQAAASNREVYYTSLCHDTWGVYNSRRRTVDFAVAAASQREASLEKLVGIGSGICVGSKRPKAGDPEPDFHSDISSDNKHNPIDTQDVLLSKRGNPNTTACRAACEISIRATRQQEFSSCPQDSKFCMPDVAAVATAADPSKDEEVSQYQCADDTSEGDSSEHDCNLVLDIGGHMARAGFAGGDAPRVVFPAVVGDPKTQPIMTGCDAKPFYVGDEAMIKRGILTLTYPIYHGVTVDWDKMEKLWSHIFYNELRVAPNECTVMLTEPSLTPKRHRELVMQSMFGTFGVRAVAVENSAVLATYSSGRCSALLVDCGESVTHMVPIYEGYVMLNAVARLDITGNDIHEFLARMLEKRKVFICNTIADIEIIRDLKEKLCYVAQNFDAEMLKTIVEKQYVLPDGNVIKIGNECFRCAEAIFQPGLLGKKHVQGLSQAIYDCVMRTEIDTRKDFFSNIVLSGGTTMLPGFVNRLEHDLKGLSPPCARVRVIAPPERKYSTWIGGSILASLNSSACRFTTKSRYVCSPHGDILSDKTPHGARDGQINSLENYANGFAGRKLAI